MSARGKRRFTWNALLWALVYPQRQHQTLPTLSGGLLICLALGIGSAAYNSANNILFITLSLLLACLILSGVLAMINFRRVDWVLRCASPLRMGQDAGVTLELGNGKKFLPSYGLWFDLAARAVDAGPPAKVESTITGKGIDLKTELAKADKFVTRERLWLPGRLEPAGTARLEWVFKPMRRGRLRVELESVGSLFPFGFLRKQLRAGESAEVIVWPAPTEYRRFAAPGAQRPAAGLQAARAGHAGDLHALRRYAPGDSHRLIHWKASARSQQLLVRQLSAESAEGMALQVDTDAGVWTRPEQFERLVSFVATLAEDLFRAGMLVSVALDAQPVVVVRRVRDLELFLDRLAVAEPTKTPEQAHGRDARATIRRKNLITFAPDGAHGVIARADGEKIATA